MWGELHSTRQDVLAFLCSSFLCWISWFATTCTPAMRTSGTFLPGYVVRIGHQYRPKLKLQFSIQRTHTHSIHPMRVAWRVTFPHLGSAHKVMHNPENVFVVPDKYTARRRVSEVSGFRTEIANGILHRCVYAGIFVHAIRLWPRSIGRARWNAACYGHQVCVVRVARLLSTACVSAVIFVAVYGPRIAV